MDLVFVQEEKTRSSFIRSVVRMLRWRYICLWSYQHYLPKRLLFMDGWYEDENSAEAISSAGCFGRQLFDMYRGSVCSTEDGIPGLVFRERTPYLAVAQESLQSMATTEVQRQFYQVAEIKTAAFMACESGVIELGTSSTNDNLKMGDIRNLFAEDVIRQFQLGHPPHNLEQRIASSSFSSLPSISLDSPADSASLLMNLPTTSSLLEPMIGTTATSLPTTNNPHPYTTLAPNFGIDDARMMQALLVVLSSSSTSSSSLQSTPPSSRMSSQSTAFKRYRQTISLSNFIRKSGSRSQNLMKLSIAVLRVINQGRIEAEMRENRPTTRQISHVISERKRREKLNESFQVLRALLPHGSKKDKASVLSTTREYITALREEISELKDRYRGLEARILHLPTPSSDETRKEQPSSSSEGREIIIVEVESMADEREIEMKVCKQIDLMDLVLRLLECIKNMNKVELLAVTAEVDEEKHRSFVAMKLKIKGVDWNRSKFEEMISIAVGE